MLALSTDPLLLSIYITSNNSIITATDIHGNKLISSSGGSAGFKGAKRSTAYAALRALNLVLTGLKKLINDNASGGPVTTSIIVKLRGFGKGRAAILKGLQSNINSQSMTIIKLIDDTPIAHNGCRPPKKRRL